MTLLVAFFAVPLAGGILSLVAARASAGASRWVALVTMIACLAGTVAVWAMPHPGGVLADASVPWIPALGASFHLHLDGLSLVLLALTYFLGALSVAVSWTQVTERVGFFHFNLLWVLAGVAGVFLALDLLLFSFFWELMLIPMYLLIRLWGSERRLYASVKFFIFTQAGGLLMLVAIVGLAIVHRSATGVLTFDAPALAGTPMAPATAMWLMLGFLAAFLVKLPAVPLHTWLPDAHTQAPTAGSVVLAGLLLKTGAYGLLRFVLPLFPDAAVRFAPVAMVLGVIGILYGAVLAFAQPDLKRLVAYTSVSHLGFVLLGAFAFNPVALEGVVMQMVAHGLSTGGLFVVVGFLYERLHTRDMRKMGGLWHLAPRMGVAGMFFALASLGLPGLANFVAELLILVGSFRAWRGAAVAATVGLVAATVYSLWLMQRTFQGAPAQGLTLTDLRPREVAIAASMVVVLLWLGLFPQPLLDLAAPALAALHAPGLVAAAGVLP